MTIDNDEEDFNVEMEDLKMTENDDDVSEEPYIEHIIEEDPSDGKKKVRIISSCDYDRSLIDRPFKDHKLHTEGNVLEPDIDRILRPILEAHDIAPDDYDPDNFSFKIGEKIIQLSVSGYKPDSEFERSMRFIEKKVDVQTTVFISNNRSIKGTEILIDFLKSFQREFPKSYFEIVKDGYRREAALQKFYAGGDLIDPEEAWFLEIEDPEAYLQELDNDG